MGQKDGKPPLNSYFTEDLGQEGSADDSSMGYEFMLKNQPASRPGDKPMRVSPLVGSEPHDSNTVISGPAQQKGLRISKHAEKSLYDDVDAGSLQYPGADWGK